MKRSATALLTLLPALAQGAEATAAAPSAAGSLLQVFVGLVAVLGLIAATAWMAKRMGVARTGSSALLNVVGSASVGTRERVVVLEIGDNWLVVGVGPGNVNALATLPKGEAPASPAVPLPPFAARLQSLLDKNRGTR
ncbi:MAG: flagellar biosynthetic protein FliO [Hydrogenophilales bacterium 16-64-46]|nr:MAG: flagellar biosynthetic protein FliO [Hydrogenophilales bacterium 12-64-13]OYZ04098.1 MAG: flagellar biosynthetic protein FliO [Hydrogenophilales bacterium 16-64-46]OZA36847.1 MAG: flagellar biosynthetic protein FliO [Hydrogenophilales bacterium 17-64-34]HQT00041.1 flagellar biosynthetic protein FliO [Thiobacillus sp.]